MGSNKRDRIAAEAELKARPTGAPGPRVIVTADRSWSCRSLAAEILRRLGARHGPGLVIVHGDATGVDESFASACRGLGIAQEPHPADWDRLGKRAGPIRNGAMVAAGADICLVLHPFIGNSKGRKTVRGRPSRRESRRGWSIRVRECPGD